MFLHSPYCIHVRSTSLQSHGTDTIDVRRFGKACLQSCFPELHLMNLIDCMRNIVPCSRLAKTRRGWNVQKLSTCDQLLRSTASGSCESHVTLPVVPCGQHCAEQNPRPSLCRAFHDLKKTWRIPKTIKCKYIKNYIWWNMFTINLWRKEGERNKDSKRMDGEKEALKDTTFCLQDDGTLYWVCSSP